MGNSSIVQAVRAWIDSNAVVSVLTAVSLLTIGGGILTQGLTGSAQDGTVSSSYTPPASTYSEPSTYSSTPTYTSSYSDTYSSYPTYTSSYSNTYSSYPSYSSSYSGGDSCSACYSMPSGPDRDRCYATPPCSGGYYSSSYSYSSYPSGGTTSSYSCSACDSMSPGSAKDQCYSTPPCGASDPACSACNSMSPGPAKTQCYSTPPCGASDPACSACNSMSPGSAKDQCYSTPPCGGGGYYSSSYQSSAATGTMTYEQCKGICRGRGISDTNCHQYCVNDCNPDGTVYMCGTSGGTTSSYSGYSSSYSGGGSCSACDSMSPGPDRDRCYATPPCGSSNYYSSNPNCSSYPGGACPGGGGQCPYGQYWQCPSCNGPGPCPATPCMCVSSGGGNYASSYPGSGMDAGADRCFTSCSQGISGGDSRYEACRQQCFGGNRDQYNYGMPGYGHGQGGFYFGSQMPYPPGPGGNQQDFQAQQQDIMKQQLRYMGESMQSQCQGFAMAQQGAPASLSSQIQALANECTAAMKILTDSATDFGTFQFAAQRKMEEFRQKLNTLFYSIRSDDEKQGALRYIQEMKSGANSATQMIAKVRSQNPKAADEMEEMRSRMLAIIAKAEAALSQGQTQEVFRLLDSANMELNQRMQRWQQYMGGFGDEYGYVDNSGLYDDVSDDFGGKNANDHFKKFNYGRHDLEFMQTAVAIGGDDFKKKMARYFQNQDELSDFGDESSDLITAASKYADISILDELIDAKNTLLEEISGLKDELRNLKSQVKEIVEAIKRFNFADASLAEKATELAKNIEDKDPAEAQEELEQYQRQSIEKEYASGLSPFADVSVLNPEWYTDYAKEAKVEYEVIKGESNGTLLNPARATNVAEAITMAVRVSGEDIDEDAEPTTELGQKFAADAEWSAPYIVVMENLLENYGHDFAEVFEGVDSASDQVTRGQTMVMLADALDLPEGDLDAIEEFKDLKGAPEYERLAAAALVESGIIQGYADDTLRMDGNLNRAEFAKIAVEGIRSGEEESR